MDDNTEWALRARDGDPVAEAALVRGTQVDVWRLCAGLVDRDSADDLTQETFLRAFKALRSFEGRSSVRTWLLGIARHVCMDHLAALVRRRRLEDTLRRTREATDPGPAGAIAALDLLRRLDPDRRTAFVLTQLVGLPYAEVAEVEKCPIGTIRSRVSRAREDLIGLLTAEEAVS